MLPIQGSALDPFMRCHLAETNSKVGPGTYYPRKLPHHLPNVTGFKSKLPGAGACVAIVSKYQNDEFYDVTCTDRKIRPDKKPFGAGAKIERVNIKSDTPG